MLLQIFTVASNNDTSKHTQPIIITINFWLPAYFITMNNVSLSLVLQITPRTHKLTEEFGVSNTYACCAFIGMYTVMIDGAVHRINKYCVQTIKYCSHTFDYYVAMVRAAHGYLTDSPTQGRKLLNFAGCN